VIQYTVNSLCAHDFIITFPLINERFKVSFLANNMIYHTRAIFGGVPNRHALPPTQQTGLYTGQGQIQSPSLSPITWQFLIFTIFTITTFIFSFTRSIFHFELFGKSFPPWTFPLLPDWLHGVLDHLTFLFCSTAGFVRMVC